MLLQAGVGCDEPGGVLGYLVDEFGAKDLHSIIVEPDLADCLTDFQPERRNRQCRRRMATIMAGLACGRTLSGWDLMRNCDTVYLL